MPLMKKVLRCPTLTAALELVCSEARRRIPGSEAIVLSFQGCGIFSLRQAGGEVRAVLDADLKVAVESVLEDDSRFEPGFEAGILGSAREGLESLGFQSLVRARVRSVKDEPLGLLVLLRKEAGSPSPAELACFGDLQDGVELALRVFGMDAVPAHEMLRMVADATNDALWNWDLDSGEVSWNSGLEKMFGYPPGDEVSTIDFWVGSIHSDDHDRVVSSIHQNIMHDMEDWNEEYRFRHRDGYYLRVLDRGRVVRDTNGRPRRMIGSMTDVTAISLAEERVRAQAELIDKSKEAFIVVSSEGTIELWSAGAERVFSRPRTEALGTRFTSLFSRGDQAQVSELLRMAQIRGESSRELRLEKAAGDPLILDCRFNRIRSHLGEESVILAILGDITEKRVFERHLLRSQRLESIGTLAGGIAHDLNNMLAPIILSSEILERHVPEGAPGRKHLNTIKSSARRGAELVKQVLIFSRGLEAEKLSVDLRTLLFELQNMLGDTMPGSVEFRLDLPDELPPLEGNPTRIQQALLNLCLNARDAMPDGGALTIAVQVRDRSSGVSRSADARELVLRVVDTGTGIPDSHRDRIFEPFFTTKAPGTGTGLGLSTTHSIVKSMGGEIRVQSAVGQGTTFELVFPVTDPALAVEASPGRTEPKRGNGEWILVVDDEASVRESLRDLLDMAGYKTLTASRGDECLNLLKVHGNRISLLITDLMMPDLNGLELIEEVSHRRPGLPVIASSGASDAASFNQLRGSLGAPIFIPKPYSAECLLRAVASRLAMTDGIQGLGA